MSSAATAADLVRNTTWDELQPGATASLRRACAVQDLYLFAHVSGNTNPIMLPPALDGSTTGDGAIAPSMWVGSLISAVLGNKLPGPGTIYRAQSLRFERRVHVGDELVVTVTCTGKGKRPLATFDTRVETPAGELVCSGEAEVDAPLEAMALHARVLPELILDQHDHFAALLRRAQEQPALHTAVVCPDDGHALGGALLSAREGLIVPILIGDAAAIRRAADKAGLDLSGFAVQDVVGHREAAARAVALAASGEVGAIMKGNLHSDVILAEVVRKEAGLRTSRRISHVFAMDVPTLDHLLFISDAAINIAPDLQTKVDITQNAIDLARACGLEQPRVGVLSAVETVNVNIPSTLDAAILSKMSDRGQITGGLVDGPLAMDNAIDLEAARTKGIASLVAGRAQILIVPNLEAGNMLAKELTFIARAEAAGLVMGARVPVMLTSRADNEKARLASCALAQLAVRWQRTNAMAGH